MTAYLFIWSLRILSNNYLYKEFKKLIFYLLCYLGNLVFFLGLKIWMYLVTLGLSLETRTFLLAFVFQYVDDLVNIIFISYIFKYETFDGLSFLCCMPLFDIGNVQRRFVIGFRASLYIEHRIHMSFSSW